MFFLSSFVNNNNEYKHDTTLIDWKRKKKDEQAAAPTTGKKKKWSRLLTRLLLLLLSVQFSQRPSPFPSSHIFHGKPCPVELRSSIALPLPFYSPTHLSSSHSKYFPLVFLPVFLFLCYQKTKSMPKAKCTGETERPRDKETWDRTEREHDTKGERVRLDKQGRTGWRKRERAREGGIWSGEEGELDHGSSNFLTIQFQTNTNTPPHLTPSFPFLFPFLSSPSCTTSNKRKRYGRHFQPFKTLLAPITFQPQVWIVLTPFYFTCLIVGFSRRSGTIVRSDPFLLFFLFPSSPFHPPLLFLSRLSSLHAKLSNLVLVVLSIMAFGFG